MKRIKTIIGSVFLLAVVLGSGYSLFTENFYSNKIPKKYLLDGEYIGSENVFQYYLIDGTENEVAVGIRDGVNASGMPFEIPDSVSIANKNYSVTGIWREGFSRLDNIKVTFPSTLKTIDYEAFFNTTFSANNTQLTIPYTVSGLGTAAFFKTNITDLVFSDGESSNIGVCATTETQNNDSQTSTGTKSALETISDFAFAKCKDLKNITFSNSLKNIKQEAFEYCEGLTTVAFLSGLEHIGSRAFNCCYSLAQVYLPNNLFSNSSDTNSTIGEFAFSFCKDDMKIQASSTGKNLPDSFYKQNPNWSRKKEFSTDSYSISCVSGDMYISSSWLYQDTGSSVTIQEYLGDAMENIAFPEIINGHPVTDIDKDCFKNLSNEDKVKVKRFFLPKTLVSIPDELFSSKFSTLTYVGALQGNNCYTIPTEDNIFDLSKLENLKTIGENSFQGDRDKIYTIKLPGNLMEIKRQAFLDLKSVTSLSFENRTSSESLSIGEKAFFQLGTNVANGNVKLDFPKELIKISNNAFAGANCLSELAIEGNTDKELDISSKVFAGCKNLNKVIIGKRSSLTIGQRAFAAAIDDNQAPEDYSFHPYLQYVYLPSTNLSLTNDCFDRQLRTAIYFDGDKPTNFTPVASFTEETDDKKFSENKTLNFLHKSLATKFNFSVTPRIFANTKLASEQGTQKYSIYDEGLNDGSSSSRCTYLLDHDTKKAILTKYRFNMNDRKDGENLSVEIPKTITYGDVDYTVTEIGEGAFENCDGYQNSKVRTINSISLPDSIEKIGNYAFFRCVGLDSMKMPSSLKSIGELAFAFTGISSVSGLNSDVDFLDSTGNTILGNCTKSSPFLNCPNLGSISLTKKENSKIQVSDNRCLEDSSGYILTIFPKFNGTDKTFDGKKFYFGAYKTVNWIENLTISPSDFPTNLSQSLFVGFASQDDIRTNLKFKGRITSITDKSHVSPIDVLTLKTDSNGNLSFPPDSFANAKIRVIRIPYSSEGTIPSNLLKGVSVDDNVIFQVQQGKDGLYNNGGEEALEDSSKAQIGLLDFGTDSGYKIIGDSAFQGITGIKVLNIPTIESIGKQSFFDCTNLRSVTFGDCLDKIGTSAFSISDGKNIVSSLQTIKTGNKENYINAKTIELSAFYKTKITTLEIGKKVTDISERAFRSSSLKALTFEDDSQESGKNTLTIGVKAFEACPVESLDFSGRSVKLGPLRLIDSPTATNDNPPGAFYICTSLRSVKFGDKETSIGVETFRGCKNLQNITFGKGIKEIFSFAFQDTALEDADLSMCSQLTEINGFYFCKSLKMVKLPNSIISIGKNAFNGCSALTSITVGTSASEGGTSSNTITLPDSLISIGDSAFQGCTSITSITIPSNVTTIGANAFNGCTKLGSVDLSDSLISIGDSAFHGCAALKLVILPNSLQSIGKSAFQSSGITEIVLPESLTSLGESCFDSCSNLVKIIFKGKNFSMPTHAIYNCDSLISVIFQANETNNGYAADCISNCPNLSLVVLPENFDLKSNTKIFSGCPLLATTGHVCVGLRNSEINLGNWKMLNDTESIKVAYKNGSTAMIGDMVLWDWKQSSKEEVEFFDKSGNKLESNVSVTENDLYGLFLKSKPVDMMCRFVCFSSKEKIR